MIFNGNALISDTNNFALFVGYKITSANAVYDTVNGHFYVERVGIPSTFYVLLSVGQVPSRTPAPLFSTTMIVAIIAAVAIIVGAVAGLFLRRRDKKERQETLTSYFEKSKNKEL